MTIIQLKVIYAIRIYLVGGTKPLNLAKNIGFIGDKFIFVGVIDGRNI